MLKKVYDKKNIEDVSVYIKDVEFNKMFSQSLEYMTPARGTFNISHTGMLIPESHQIFVCASNCLRGVILTAAEIHRMNRFSTIDIKQNMLYDGSMEYAIIDGVRDIINKLNYRPKAVLLYFSCMHHFMGIDIDMIMERIKNENEGIDFIDCYMNPTLRKSGITPDENMRMRLYRLLDRVELLDNTVAFVGNDLKMDEDSELVKVLENNNIDIKEIHRCKNYEMYKSMSQAKYYIVTYNSAKKAGKDMEMRLGGTCIYMSNSFDYNEIENEISEMCRVLNIKNFDKVYYENMRKKCDDKLKELKELIGDKKICIDYTFTNRTLSLAKLLLDRGFNVDRIYADSFIEDDKEDFNYIKNKYGNVKIYPTSSPYMQYVDEVDKKEDYLAIGQKAAFFTKTNNFVNVIEGGGFFGFQGIIKIVDLIEDAYKKEKDMVSLISIKGLGCEECVL